MMMASSPFTGSRADRGRLALAYLRDRAAYQPSAALAFIARL
jgi:hypothetical protein